MAKTKRLELSARFAKGIASFLQRLLHSDARHRPIGTTGPPEDGANEPNGRPLRVTAAEAIVLHELRNQEQGVSRPRLADSYQRLLGLARSDDPIDSILAAHLVREILSTTPRAVGIELVPERLEYENKVADLSRTWPAGDRGGDPPPAALNTLRRLLDDHDQATGRAREGPRALLTRQDAAVSGYVPDLSIRRWLDLSRRGSAYAHRIRNLKRDLPTVTDTRRLVDELTATLVAAIAPFYIGVGELDDLLALKNPTASDAERVADLLRTPAQYAYFFDRCGEQWLRPMASVRNMFAEPPGLIDVGGGYVRTPDWPQGRFLTRLAPADPDFVVSMVQQVRGSTNPVVVAQIVKVAQALPQAQAATLADRIAAAMLDPLAVEFAGIEAADLALRLAQSNLPSPASRLLVAVIDAAIASPRDAEWYLERATAEPIDAIARAGEDIGPGLRQRLVNAVNQAGPLRDYPTMLVTRVDIRPRHHVDKIWCLANALLRVLVTSELKSAKSLTSELIADPQRILGRVALAAVGQRPQLLDNADAVLLEAARFDDANTTRFEFRLALASLWKAASVDGQEAVLRYAESADEPAQISERLTADQVPGAPGADDIRRQWRSQLLSRIREDIPPAWLERIGPLDAVEDYGPAEPLVEIWIPKSPVTEDELATLEPEAVIAVLDQWATADSARFDTPGPEGLAIAVAGTVVSRLQEFSLMGPVIAGVHPRFVTAITSAIERGMRDDQIHDQANAVTFTFGLGEALLVGGRQDQSWTEARRNIAAIIAMGARRNLLSHASSVTAIGLLRLLLRDTDPTPESEEGDVASRYDVGMLAMNSVRGAATTATIELLLHLNRSERPELADEAADLLRAVIGADYSRSVRAAVGIRLPWLLEGDSGHRSQWLDILFGAGIPDVAREATWDAYLLFSHFFLGTASSLAGEYDTAVEHLPDRGEDDTRLSRDRDERLGIHVAMAHLLVMPAEARGQWVAAFYNRAADWLRARVTRWVAEQAATDDGVPGVGERARALLRDRVGRGDEVLQAEELRAVGWVSRTHVFEVEVLEGIVLPALERTGGATDDETGVADLVARCSKAKPLVAARALRLLVSGDTWHALPHIAGDSLRRSLAALTVADDPEARTISQGVVHTLGALGFPEYRDLLRGEGQR